MSESERPFRPSTEQHQRASVGVPNTEHVAAIINTGAPSAPKPARQIASPHTDLSRISADLKKEISAPPDSSDEPEHEDEKRSLFQRLKNSYYESKLWELQLYRKLGVRRFRKYVLEQNTDQNGEQGSDRLKLISSDPRVLQKIIDESIYYENMHYRTALLASTVTVLGLYASYFFPPVGIPITALSLGFNIIWNVPAIMVQREVRALATKRLEGINKAKESATTSKEK